MVYMYSINLNFCIRNARAALVMKYGIGPFYDLQASSYAYKMWIWPNDQIWNVKIMCIPLIPIISC